MWEANDVAHRVNIAIQGLSLWANGFRENPHNDEHVLTRSDDKITFEMPSPWNAEVVYEDVNIQLRRTWASSHDPALGFHATQEAVFILEGDIPLNTIRDTWLPPLHRLVGFWTLGPVEVSQVTAYIRVPFEDREESFPLEVCYRYHQREPEYGPPVTRVVHWLAPLDQLMGDSMPYETLISRWLRLDESYQATIGYLQEASDKNLPIDRQLLAAFMGVEAYHAVKVEKGELPDRGFNSEQKLTDVVNLTDSTRQRFSSVYPGLPALTRNLRHTAAHGHLLWNSSYFHEWIVGTIWLRWTLRHLILSELGMSEGTICSLFDDCFRFRQDIHHLERLNSS